MEKDFKTATETILDHERDYFKKQVGAMNNQELLYFQKYNNYMQFHQMMQGNGVSLALSIGERIKVIEEEIERRLKYFEQNIWPEEQNRKRREMF